MRRYTSHSFPRQYLNTQNDECLPCRIFLPYIILNLIFLGFFNLASRSVPQRWICARVRTHGWEGSVLCPEWAYIPAQHAKGWSGHCGVVLASWPSSGYLAKIICPTCTGPPAASISLPQHARSMPQNKYWYTAAFCLSRREQEWWPELQRPSYSPKLQPLPHGHMHRQGKLACYAGTVQGNATILFKVFPAFSDWHFCRSAEVQVSPIPFGTAWAPKPCAKPQTPAPFESFYRHLVMFLVEEHFRELYGWHQPVPSTRAQNGTGNKRMNE